MKDVRIGDKVYFVGDNTWHDGWFEVTGFYKGPADKEAVITLTEVEGTGFSFGRLRNVAASMIHTEKRADTLFMTEEAYKAWNK